MRNTKVPAIIVVMTIALLSACNVDNSYTPYSYATGSSQVDGVVSLSLDKQAYSVGVSGTVTPLLTINPSSAKDNAITWASSNPGIATISSAGVVTGVAPGSSTISAVAPSGATAKATVKVVQGSIVLSATSSTIPVNGTTATTVTFTPATSSPPSVAYSSSDTSIATISSAGVVTGVTVGSATITANAGINYGSATCSISVANVFSITYDANGGSGSVPVDTTKYLPGSTITVLGGGALTRSGYTFAGWNTTAAGSGTTYAAGSTFSMGSANVTLYAKWTASTNQSISASLSVSDTTIYSFELFTLSVTVTDPNVGAAISSYTWNDSIGSWTTATSTTTDYIYGNTSSNPSISCTVTDSYGNTVTATTIIAYVPAGALKIVNSSSSAITGVYLSSPSSTTWGSNILSSSIPSGSSHLIYDIATGTNYNIKINNSALDITNDSYAVFSFSGSSEYVLTYSGSTWDGTTTTTRSLRSLATRGIQAVNPVGTTDGQVRYSDVDALGGAKK